MMRSKRMSTGFFPGATTQMQKMAVFEQKADIVGQKTDAFGQKTNAFERNYATKTLRCRRHGPPSIHPDRRRRIYAVRLVNSNSLTNTKFRNNIRRS